MGPYDPESGQILPEFVSPEKVKEMLDATPDPLDKLRLMLPYEQKAAIAEAVSLAHHRTLHNYNDNTCARCWAAAEAVMVALGLPDADTPYRMRKWTPEESKALDEARRP